MLSDGLPEKAQSGLLVAMAGQKKINSLTFLIDSPVQACPLPFDLDVRFVHPPVLADRALLPLPENRLRLRRELLDPAVDVGMINWYTSFCHHFFQISVAGWVSQVPADTGSG
jgi:hypothetical protein